MSVVNKLWLLVAFLAVLFFAVSVKAETIARSFDASGNVEPGRVVALMLSDNTKVELAPASDPSRIYGVVIEETAAPVTLQEKAQKIFVATGGAYPTFVSTENGAITSGDYLSISSSDGVAAKLTKKQSYVVGRAAENYDGSSGRVGDGKNGAAIGKIKVEILPGKNPNLREGASVPAPLKRLGEEIAGKPLSPARIYSALAIFLITTAVAFFLLWVGVSSGMIAIGRNPLSKHSIMQNLAQVIVASTLVFTGGLFGIYLLLRF